MDAFGAAHRAHASTEGAVRAARVACAGPLMAAELAAFARVLDAPARPLMAIIGGSKVSTKLGLLDNLLGKVDTLIVGGGIANTFLAAAGYGVGTSPVRARAGGRCQKGHGQGQGTGQGPAPARGRGHGQGTGPRPDRHGPRRGQGAR